MNRKEIFIDNKGVNLHVLVINASEQEIPIVIIPGAINSAEQIDTGLAGKLSHYHIIISIRGRGQSSAPTKGYTLTDQVSDVLAVVKHLQLNKYYLFGYSVGAGIAIRVATQDASKLMGLILGDYPPIYPSFDEKWIKMVKEIQPDLRDAFVYGLAADSEFENLFSELIAIKCPALLLKGGQTDSLFSPKLLPKFKENTPNCEVVILEESGHDIFDPKPEILANAILAFTKKC